VGNSYTPGLKLRQPAQGDDYWDDDLNANANILEATLGRGGGINGVIGNNLLVWDGGGLNAAYTAGSCRVGGNLRTLTAGTKACANNALSFIYVGSAGNVHAETSLPNPVSTPYCPLALVETSGGDIVRISDLRRCIVDALAEHSEAGAHGQITPSRVSPSGTDGAYRRSPASGYQDPENRVNNIIIKNDTNQLWSIYGRSNGYTMTQAASDLGSGYVPVDANAIILAVQVWDTANGALSRWRFYPEGTTDENIKESAVARVFNPADTNGNKFYYQLIVRLSSGGSFRMEAVTDGGATCASRGRLVGWIEPA
jgi:hypothetical protein